MEPNLTKKQVGILGATGLAGQQFLASLTAHPQFAVAKVAASERSAGKTYAEAIGGHWYCKEPLDEAHAGLVVEDAAKMSANGLDLVFSAVESEPAKTLEPKFARDIPVISTASAFRYEPDVPIFLPGVNLGHAGLLAIQRRQRGFRGFITPGANCTTVGLAMTLKPLHAAFGVERVFMTSLQAVSGAGRSPGVIALDILDNVVPFIRGEEEKVERETHKILGTLRGEAIDPAPMAISCTCMRVPVLEGHTESVFVQLAKKSSPTQAAEVLRAYRGDGLEGLPSAPRHLITVRDEADRPQPRLDRDTEDGMSTVVGRLRADSALPNGLKYVLVSHNTKMGAAKGAILTAEWLLKHGHLT